MPGEVRRRDREVHRARDVAQAPDVALEAVVLRRAARVHQQDVGGAEEAADVRGGHVAARLEPRREQRRLGTPRADRDRHARPRSRPGSRRPGRARSRTRRRAGSTRRGPRGRRGCRRRAPRSSRRPPRPPPSRPPSAPGRRGAACRRPRSARTTEARQSTWTAPGTWPAAWSCAAVPSGRQRTSTTRTSGRPRLSASQSGVAISSGRAKSATRPPGRRDGACPPI